MRSVFFVTAVLALGASSVPAGAQSPRCVDFTIAGTSGKVCGDGKTFAILDSAGKEIAKGDWMMAPESRGSWHVDGKLSGVPMIAFEVYSDGPYENKLAVKACVSEATSLVAGKTKLDYAKGACDSDWRPIADFPFRDPS